MVVLLQNIRSLPNVGSIFRTADAVGVEKLYLCGITPSPLDRFKQVPPQLAKVALGAEKTVPWEKVATTAQCIKALRRQGFTIIGLEVAKNAVPYYALPKTIDINKMALILGAEVEGISPALLKKCDTIIDIPMQGIKESLNVGVAFGIVAYHLKHVA